MEEFLLTKTQIINSNKCRFSNILSSMKSSANIITDFGWGHGHIIDSIRRAYGWGFLFFLRQYCHPNSKKLHTSSFSSLTPSFQYLSAASLSLHTYLPTHDRAYLNLMSISATRAPQNNIVIIYTLLLCSAVIIVKEF